MIAFVDTTAAYDDKDRVTIMPAIEKMAAPLLSDQRLAILTVRDRAESSPILFDRCVLKTSDIAWSFQGLIDWLVSSPAEARVERATFFDDVKRALMPELQAASAASKTALVETLGHGFQVMGEGRVDRRDLEILGSAGEFSPAGDQVAHGFDTPRGGLSLDVSAPRRRRRSCCRHRTIS